MIGWSMLRPVIFHHAKISAASNSIKRSMSDHRLFPMTASRFQWRKFKDLLHFYAIGIGIIPLTCVSLFANIFVGPATLCETPEGCEPKYWEYYQHPLTRLLARYCINNPQQEYEKFLHYLYEEDEKIKLRELEAKIRMRLAKNNDYQAYYFRPIMAKYDRLAKEMSDFTERIEGD